MRKALRFAGIILVVFALVGPASSFAQDKPAAGQDKKESAAAADPLTGDWDGSVESQNGAMPFTMKLKLEKDKFTGEIASNRAARRSQAPGPTASSPPASTTTARPVAMTGTLKEAVLGGEMNFGGGQMVMTWTAKKK